MFIFMIQKIKVQIQKLTILSSSYSDKNNVYYYGEITGTDSETFKDS